MPKKTLKRQRKQRGGEVFTFPGYKELHTYINGYYEPTEKDKIKERLSMFKKVNLINDLLESLYYSQGKFLTALKKSKTPFIEQRKNRIDYPYDENWLENCLITKEQIDDYLSDNINICPLIVLYLKEMHILITGNPGIFARENDSEDKYQYLYKICNSNLELQKISQHYRNNENSNKLQTIFNSEEDISKILENNYNLVIENFNEIRKQSKIPKAEIFEGTNRNSSAIPDAGNAKYIIPEATLTSNKNNNDDNIPIANSVPGGTRKKRRRRNKSTKK